MSTPPPPPPPYPYPYPSPDPDPSRPGPAYPGPAYPGPAYPGPAYPGPAAPPPGYGYPVPPGYGAPPPSAGGPESDPLVPPPWGGLEPLFNRLIATFRRSWLTLGVIVLLTFALPQVLQQLLSIAIGLGTTVSGFEVSSAGEFDLEAGELLLTGLVALLAQVLVLFVYAIGWGAGIWAVTQQAAGQPAPVGDALRAGLRRTGQMFGWFVLFVLMVFGGLIACILPGIYLFVAGSLFGFVVFFERRGGIGRSFGLVHRHFGAALGRVLLLLLIFIGVGLAVSDLVGSVTGVAAVGLTEAGTELAAIGLQQLVGGLVNAAVTVPLTMLMLVGLLLTYAQLRAREEQLTTGQLWAAASQP